MGSGCLKPPAPTTQLNLSSLDQIFQQAKNSNPPSSNSDQKCLAYYLEMKQVITKKGQLKKLCDYLSSHRDCISQTLLHSYRILGQSKGAGYKYIALIVLDSILGIAPKRPIVEKSNVTNQSKGSIANHSFRESSGRQQSGRNFGNGSDRQHSSDSAVLKRRVLAQVQNESIASKAMQLRTISDQFNTQKFQSIYFSIINLLIKQDNLLYKLTLQNIIKYCSVTTKQTNTSPPNILYGIAQQEYEQDNRASTRNDNTFVCENLICEIMKNISYHLIVDHEMVTSLKVCLAMLTRLKDTYFVNNLDSLSIFFDIWMTNTNTVQPSQPQQLPLSTNMPQLQPLSQIPRLCSSVLSLYLKTCIQSYQHNTILQQIFKIFDKYKWKNIVKIENLLFDCIDRVELKVQFSRALFVNLLAYVGWPQANCNVGQNVFLREQSKISQVTQQEDSGYTQLQQKWLQCYKMPPSFPSRFKNILHPQNKLNSLPKIQKWLFQYQIVNLNQLLMYSGNTIIECFIFNLYSNQQSIKEKSISQLRSLLTKFHKHNLLLQIGNCIMRQVKQNYAIEDSARWTLMAVWENAVQKQKKIDIGLNYQYVIQELNMEFCLENNVKIVYLMAKTLDRMTMGNVGIRLEEICGFLDSLYKEIFAGFSNPQCKIILIQEFGKVFQNQNSDKLKGIFVAFLQKIHKLSTINNIMHTSKQKMHQASKIQRKQSMIPQNHMLFLDLLLLTLSKILGLGLHSQNIENYCNQIKKSSLTQQQTILANYESDHIPIQFQLSIFYPPGQLSNIQLYKQSAELFKTNKMQKDATNAASIIWKAAQSFQSFYSKENTNDNDKDLEDVLDIIRY